MAELIFVGGAPRTGTSALQALICTSERANPYIGECGFLSAQVAAYVNGLGGYDNGAGYYFASREAFTDYNRNMIRRLVRQFHQHLGEPEVLCLKDPLLTTKFHEVSVLLPRARFIVTLRDPVDALRSRTRVYLAMTKAERITDPQIELLCGEFTRCYRELPDHAATLKDRLTIIEYDALSRSDYAAPLAFIGVTDVRPELMWKRGLKNHKKLRNNPWHSPLYTQGLTAERPEREEVLSEGQQALVEELCGPAVAAVREAFGTG